MKANRKFRNATEAVSPVIAVILMVAITVVLAATVFVLVSDIGSNQGTSSPAMSWNNDESLDRMVVNTAAQNADWNRLTIQVDSCTFGTGGTSLNVGTLATGGYQNEESITAGGDVATTCGSPIVLEITDTAAKIGAADYLDLCQGPATSTTPALNVKVTIKDTIANAIVTSHTFTNIAMCTA